MNVKSRYDTEELEPTRPSQHMRGMCATPFSMISGPTRMDVSNLRPPGFLRRIFQALGWKTGPEQNTDKK